MSALPVESQQRRLGEILIEMRHAPDARLLLEVALVQLTHQAAAHDVGALMDRIERLEKAIAEGVPSRPAGTGPVATPVDPATGRVPLVSPLESQNGSRVE